MEPKTTPWLSTFFVNSDFFVIFLTVSHTHIKGEHLIDHLTLLDNTDEVSAICFSQRCSQRNQE